MTWPDDWTKIRELTIPAAQVGTGGVLDYSPPLKIYAPNAKADGSDIRIATGDDGSGLLNTHVIRVVGGGYFIIRFGPTSLSAVVPNTFYEFSGNSGASAQTAADAYSANQDVYVPLIANGTNVLSGASTTEHGTISYGGLSDYGLGAGTLINGASNYLDIDLDTALSGVQPCTISCWCYSVSPSDLIAIGSDASFEVALRTTSSKYSFVLNSLGTSDRAEDGTVPTSTWFYLAGEFDGTNIKVYGQGALLDDNATSGTYASTSAFALGKFSSSTSQLGLGDIVFHRVARGTAWHTTEYNAIHDNASFLTEGTEEDFSPSGGGFQAAWAMNSNMLMVA